MKYLFAAALLLAAVPAFAIDNEDCREMTQLGTLYEVRAYLLQSGSQYSTDQFIDRRLGALREGWVRWVRPDGDAPEDKHLHTVRAVNGSASDSFEAAGQHPFAVKIVVPAKRSLFKGNNAVYVGDVKVSYDVEGQTKTKKESINAWMSPDTSRTIDLGAIADHADTSLDASTTSKDSNQALVEIHFVQAVPRDDPNNPAYDTIQSLDRIRRYTTADTVDDEVARAERRLFPSAEPLPLAGIIEDLRRADSLIRSKKEEDQAKGEKLLRETLRRLR